MIVINCPGNVDQQIYKHFFQFGVLRIHPFWDDVFLGGTWICVECLVLFGGWMGWMRGLDKHVMKFAMKGIVALANALHSEPTTFTND